MRESSEGEARASVRWFQWPGVLCLDAPVVAVVWMLLFVAAFGLHLRPVLGELLLPLALAVWCIYAVDRVFDVTGRAVPPTARHRFARRNRWWMVGGVALAAPLGGWLALRIAPAGLINIGLVLGLVVLWHLAYAQAHRRSVFVRVLSLASAALVALLVLVGLPSWIALLYLGLALILSLSSSMGGGREMLGYALLPKELACAGIFSVAVTLPVAFYLSQGRWEIMLLRADPGLVINGALFLVLCLLHGILLSADEEGRGGGHDPGSMVRHWPALVGLLPIALGGLAVVAVGYALGTTPRGGAPAIAVALAATGHLAILRWGRGAGVEGRRALADLCLVLPAAGVVLAL
jgi:hypothetical protein